MTGSSFPKQNPDLEAVETAEGLELRHRRELWSALLNRPAATIWRACDGRTSVRRVSQRLQAGSELGSEEAEALTVRGIADLASAGLVVTATPWAARTALSRRQLFKILVLVGLPTALLPKVVRAGWNPTPQDPERQGGASAAVGEQDARVLGTTTTTTTSTSTTTTSTTSTTSTSTTSTTSTSTTSTSTTSTTSTTTTSTTPVPVELTGFTVE